MKQQLPELAGAGSFLVSPKSPQRQMQKPRPLEELGNNRAELSAAARETTGSAEAASSRSIAFLSTNSSISSKKTSVANWRGTCTPEWDYFPEQLAKEFQQVVAVEAAGGDLANSFRGPGKRAVEATTVEFLRTQSCSGSGPNSSSWIPRAPA